MTAAFVHTPSSLHSAAKEEGRRKEDREGRKYNFQTDQGRQSDPVPALCTFFHFFIGFSSGSGIFSVSV